MTTYSITKITTFSRLGQRGSVFGMSVLDAMKDDPRFIVLTADLALLSGLDRFSKMYPDNLVNVGIAEQNMLGIAAGLAAEGYKPVVTTYATFITLRSCEQIRHYLGYMNLKVIVIGTGAGLIQGFSGNTHYSIEDLAVMRAIPNLTVLSPSDAGQAVKAFEAAQAVENSVYIRLTGGLGCPIVYQNDYEFRIGYPIIAREGADVAIFATGQMVASSLKAAGLLEEHGISTRVVDVHSIKPMIGTEILRLLSPKLNVTVEEHNIYGGLGGAISEILSDQGGTPPLLRLGIQDKFSRVGDYNFLLSENRLEPEQITADILKKYISLP